MIVDDLLKGGAKLENITLLCATGLHRKNTLEEWYWYLGKEIVDRFWPDRLVNHEAEAPDMGIRTMINEALRLYVEKAPKPVDETVLRQVHREELKRAAHD